MKGGSRPGTIALDVRCLQDPDYARRGVGRHALAILHHAPPDARLVGLIDADLPPLIPEARDRLAHLVPNAYAAAAELDGAEPACFIALSPMTHDPLFTARLLSDDRLRRVAVVYDFIPYREPRRYLPDAAQRLAYMTRLRWLARFDSFAAISQSTANELRQLLKLDEMAVAVTGAPIDPLFEAAGSMPSGSGPRHVLVVGGADPRKNPEVVIRAHARSAILQQAGIPLLILGNYGQSDAEAFRGIAMEAGGRGDLLDVPGHVSEADLRKSYGQALLVVCPSRAEGFSLPVAEAMAAGVPCLASDIPAQRELLRDEEVLFAPDDVEALQAALDRLAGDAAGRAAIVARQEKLWPCFRAAAVGRRFWDVALQHAGSDSIPAPGLLRGRKPRVAVLSPLPPDQSGVADYTAATCPALGALTELHVFTETLDPKLREGISGIHPMTALPHLMPGFDRVISVLGNSHFHLRIFDLFRRYGGACIAHDARMLHFYHFCRGSEQARLTASRELGRAVDASEVDGWLADESKLQTLFLGEIAEGAAPMMVHSAVTARLVRERYGVMPAYLPFSIYRPWSAGELTAAARAVARERLGIPSGEVAIVTFGYVLAGKAPEECIKALDHLRGLGIPASLHFAGGLAGLPDKGAALRALTAALNLTPHVRFMGEGFVSETAYRDYLVGSDLAIQLRSSGFGGLSGALLDCAAAGLPTVTNTALGEAVGIPADYMRCIPDIHSPAHLAEALADLLRTRVSASEHEARRHAYSEERSLAKYARRLCDALGLDVAVSR